MFSIRAAAVFRPLLWTLAPPSKTHFSTRGPLPFHRTNSCCSSPSNNAMAATTSFLDAVRQRRTCYQLHDRIPISDDRVEEIVREAMKYVPSSFNSQSTRLVVLLND